jgi:outer membrane protein
VAAAPEPPVLSLNEAVRLALANNPRIGIARNDAAIASNEHTLGNAGLLPSLDLTARQNRRALGGSADLLRQTADLSSSLNVTVFDGLRGLNAYRRLGVLERQAEVAAEGAAEDALADMVLLYFEIAGQQQRIAALREAIATSEERLRIAQLRLEVGAASQLAVNQARVDLNADRAALLRQETALVAARAQLDHALGRPAGEPFRVSDTIVVDRSLHLEPLRQTAMQQNRDLQVAARGEEAAALRRREVRAEYLPTVDLALGYAFDGVSEGLGLAPGIPQGWTYGLTVRLPVFDGFNRGRHSESALLQHQNQQIRVEEVRSRILTSLQGAHESYRNSLALLDLEEENVGLARDNVTVALERFREGLSSSIELREVQNALVDAQTRLVAARVQAKHAEITLHQLGGRLLAQMEVAPTP